jgi:ppGpp synthetase/RelA/SpoT-type nucleotidyltranferase
MKIPLSVRQKYTTLENAYLPVKIIVDQQVGDLRNPNWFYSKRIKTLESYAEKLETGRYTSYELEDFFACMLVIPNMKSIGDAIALVETVCDIKYRKPENDKYTHKRPESFPFDDLRLYVEIREDPALPPTGTTGLLFEVQIKTFLQHAWSIATHDLVYKSDTLSWAKSRIAFQIKAMLEHAEISIQEAERLAKTPELDKTNSYVNKLLKIIDLLTDLWDKNDLPANVVRLAETVSLLSKELNITTDDLRKVLDEETKAGGGINLKNLSPYSIIVQSLINQRTESMKKLLSGEARQFKVFIPREVEIPSLIDPAAFTNVLYLQ